MKNFFDYAKEIQSLETRNDFVKYAKKINEAYKDVDKAEFALLKFELFHIFKSKGYKESKTFNFGSVVLKLPEEKI